VPWHSQICFDASPWVAEATPFELEGVISWLEKADQSVFAGTADKKTGRGPIWREIHRQGVLQTGRLTAS
jgi:hypothetical protein